MTSPLPPSVDPSRPGFEHSRYATVSRRALVRGTLAALALSPLLAACGNDDEEVFSDSTSGGSGTGGTGTVSAAPITAAPGTAAPGTTAPTTGAPADPASSVAATDPAASTAGTGAPASGGELPATAQLVINFTYAPSESGGRVHNPYVAVWIEDAAGELLQTVALWMKAGKTKYLRSLERWYTVESARLNAGGTDVVDEISSATRVPDAYSVVWDGSLVAGGRAAAGDVYVCIEAAREHGPYELIREPMTLGAGGASATFPDNGELSAASAEYTV